MRFRQLFCGKVTCVVCLPHVGGSEICGRLVSQTVVRGRSDNANNVQMLVAVLSVSPLFFALSCISNFQLPYCLSDPHKVMQALSRSSASSSH